MSPSTWSSSVGWSMMSSSVIRLDVTVWSLTYLRSSEPLRLVTDSATERIASIVNSRLWLCVSPFMSHLFSILCH